MVQQCRNGLAFKDKQGLYLFSISLAAESVPHLGLFGTKKAHYCTHIQKFAFRLVTQKSRNPQNGDQSKPFILVRLSLSLCLFSGKIKGNSIMLKMLCCTSSLQKKRTTPRKKNLTSTFCTSLKKEIQSFSDIATSSRLQQKHRSTS